jgi:hypothetical protein
MTDDCRNDCLEALVFPARINNRPSLSQINYRIGAYADIREALLRNLDKSPVLAQWTHRGADDPGIALLEGAAIVGDILTFYQQLYANEAYLRTSQWRESIADLVRLLGYRLSPGLGGNATFAFEVKGEQPVIVPAGFPLKAEVEGLPKPADFETSSAATAYPWLSSFNLYRRLYTPSFNKNTVEFYIFSPDQFLSPLELKPKDRLLVGEVDDPAHPRRLKNVEIVIVDAVRELHGRKIFKVKGTMRPSRFSAISHLTAFKLGRSFHHFGNNGPHTITRTPDEVKSTAVSTTANGKTTTEVTSSSVKERPLTFLRKLARSTKSSENAFHYSGEPAPVRIVIPTLGANEFPLDAEVQDLATGSRLLIQAPLRSINKADAPKEFTFIRTISRTKQMSFTWGLSTGTTSMLTLDDEIDIHEGGVYYNLADIRNFLIHEVLSPRLEIRAGPRETTLASGKELYFLGTDAQVRNLDGRRLFLTKPVTAPVPANVVEVQTLGGQLASRPELHRIKLDRKVRLANFPNEKPKVTVYGNLVDATQGKSEAESALGNGDNRLVFQTFKLPKTPLTYLISTADTPPEVPELEIYVNNRLWKRVPSLFGRDPDQEIYIVREDAENNSWVQFGDGQTGARLPSGIKNVVAKYRTGSGAFGNLKTGSKVQAGAKLDQLDKVQMPDTSSGGAEPEDGDNAREAAPGKIQSLDRLVSLRDFESETLAIAGVKKVAAAWQLVSNIPHVVLTVLMETGREIEIEAVKETLAGYNRGRGPNRFPIKVIQAHRNYVVVQATFGYDSTYREEDLVPAIQKALGINSGKPNAKDDQTGLFSLRQRLFGQREYATSVAGRIQQIEGVLWAQLTRFGSIGVLKDPAKFTPRRTRLAVRQIVPCSNQRVLSLYSGHLELTGVAETVPEVKR